MKKWYFKYGRTLQQMLEIEIDADTEQEAIELANGMLDTSLIDEEEWSEPEPVDAFLISYQEE